MAEYAFWLAVSCAVAGALCGNRTAWFLLASVVLCLTLEWQGVAFHFISWLLIDLVVVLGIVRPDMTIADDVILVLFIPAWVFYLLPDPERYIGSLIVVCAQLILTFPVERARMATSRLVSAIRSRGDEMKRVAAYAGR